MKMDYGMELTLDSKLVMLMDYGMELVMELVLDSKLVMMRDLKSHSRTNIRCSRNQKLRVECYYYYTHSHRNHHPRRHRCIQLLRLEVPNKFDMFA